MSQDEILKLNHISNHTRYDLGVNGLMIEFCASLTKKWLTGDSLLEMGPADGLSTEHLYEAVKDLEVVDASTIYLDAIRKKIPAIKCHESLFEVFDPGRKYDNIYMGHVLEHVQDPKLIISRASTWLNPHGRIIASVPNADSVHREIGVRLGLLQKTTDLNESDIRIGHRRVFQRYEFEALFQTSKLHVIESSGFFLKFYANSELENRYDREFILELMKLGQMMPGNSAELFLVAELR
jgi:2-polyprenyl-3-methyl-5-hydroxy-6-metoxy-1,4-benzoquinol methylase